MFNTIKTATVNKGGGALVTYYIFLCKIFVLTYLRMAQVRPDARSTQGMTTVWI
jgi:hypothetical protein